MRSRVRTAFAAFVLLAATASADEVTDAVDQAMQFYADGQSQQAISQLEFAAQLIRQQRGEGLVAVLPEPLDGWTAGDPSSSAAGGAMFGGGTTASRDYQKDAMSVTVQIITDSPMMSAMMMMFANPMMAASQGGSLQSIGGQQALVKPDEVMIVFNNTYLIQVQGNGASQDDLVAYAAAIDFQALADF